MTSRHLAVCAAALLLVACSQSSPEPPDPTVEGFSSLRQFATEANKAGWGCDEQAAADEQATRTSMDERGYATMTCGSSGRLTLWSSDQEREQHEQRPPFNGAVDLCSIKSANWSAIGTPEMTRGLMRELGVSVGENCTIT